MRLQKNFILYLYSLSDNYVVVVGTYTYCQKSSNNFFQRKSYSCQKNSHSSNLLFFALQKCKK
ncbi:hypothetical protein BpHYR1_003902 [Brachionus plicatilis]|uniref:Uncharacterized protein n=1 Tax=Brachionus plicatilis TaxID=10195 RepID=A0A3M7PVI0_BRAPC|nr:hypothetical protein BpHYR1_003902 [Brachionus plicatilis]